MAGYTHVNLLEVEDAAASRGVEGLEARFAREALAMEQGGMTLFRLQAGFRTPFGHTHSEQEEIYVVLAGSLRLKLDDEVLDLRERDAVRIAPGIWRAFEAGPQGAELLAFGAPHTANRDAELQPGWWTD